MTASEAGVFSMLSGMIAVLCGLALLGAVVVMFRVTRQERAGGGRSREGRDHDGA